MSFSGLSPDGRLVEIAEIADHPFMVGSQFHPEFLSRPNRPHPLFRAFLEAVAEKAGHRAEPLSQPRPKVDANTLSGPAQEGGAAGD
jgi:CTP synthase